MAKKNWLLFALTLMALIVNIDYTAVNLSLVKISHELHSELNVIQWVLGAYVLVWSAFVIPASKTIEKYGHFRICFFGLLLFLLGSIVAGFSPFAWMLILGRILQGVAAAFFVPTLYGLVAVTFPPERQGQAMGKLGLGVGLGMAIGPTFGGVILTYLGWRWIFFINVPIILFIMSIVMFTAPKSPIQSSIKLDKVASALLSIGIVSLMYALSLLHRIDMGGEEFAFFLAVAFIVFLLFFIQQSRSDDALISLKIFKNKAYAGSCIALALEQYVFAAVVVSFGLYLQKVMDLSVLNASMFFLALTLVFGLISPFSGRLVDKVGIQKPAFFGMLLLAFGMLLVALFAGVMSFWLVIVSLLIMGIGMGLAFNALNTGIITTVKPEEVGVASGIFVMLALLFNTIGVIITTMIYEVASYHRLLAYAERLKGGLNTSQIGQLHHVIIYIGSSIYNLNDFSLQAQKAIIAYIPYSLSHGLSVALSLGALVSIASALVAKILCRD